MTLRALAFAALATTTTGCLTFTARVRGGPTVDTRGNGGFEVGVAAGFGYSTSRTTSVRTTPFASVGDRGLSFGTTLEVGRLDDAVAWHAGIAAELALRDDEVLRSAYGAVMRPLRFSSDYPENEKFSFASATRKALSAGVEVRAGFGLDQDESSRGVFGLMPVLDLTMTAAD